MISIRKLKKYTPTKFANTDSTYNKRMADSAVCFINCLKHTKGEWYGQPFDLIDWQEQIVRDIFGILKPGGYRQFNTAYIEIPKKQGKQLSLNTLIPTPGGYTTMGKISVGDDVFDENGNICQVLAKSNIDCSEQAYRITFKDGEIIEAGANHEWCGQYTHGKPVSCIMTTEELLNLPKDGNSLRFRIPIAKCLKLNEVSLPVSPYLMGYWLGNENAIKPEITIKTEDISGVLKNIVYRNEISGIWHNIGDSVVVRIPDLNKILLKTFHDKKIPLKYLRSSKQQRIELLRGLMDSDGCIEKIKGQAVYCSTERGLARSVSELLWSLGIKNSITKAASTQRKDWNKRSRECGRVKTGEMLYYIKFTAFKDTRISGLYRKYKNSVECNPRTRSHFRYIDKIEKIQNRGMQCIQVNSPSHQHLVGRSCLPTHNSELAAATALLLTCGDFEHGGEVYGCASDRQQASIVFDVAVDMVEQCPALKSRIKPVLSQKG